MMHSPLFLHSDIEDKLLYDRPKNDCKQKEKWIFVSDGRNVFFLKILNGLNGKDSGVVGSIALRLYSKAL